METVRRRDRRNYRDAAAFANTEGGRIFIGISPEGHDYLDMKILEGTIPELREKA